MRAALLLLVVVSLVTVPAAMAEDPGPNGDCDVEEEYVTEASLGDPNNIDPNNLVQPGAPSLLDCKY